MTFGIALLPLALAATGPSANDVAQRYERWERRLRARVAELHSFPGGVEKDAFGDVVVSFLIGPDGRPTNALIRQSSGNADFDKAARRLVRLLGPVGPVPSMMGKDHHVALKLSYGQLPTVDADQALTRALDAERRVSSQRNLEVVTRTAVAVR